MLDRKLAPSFQKTSLLSLPRPMEVKLSSGASLFLIHGIQQNVAKVEVIFSAGKWYEPKTGLSHFTATLLEKGTVKKTSEEIAETLDYYGASLDINPGFDFVSVSLYSTKTNFSKVFPVFIEIIQAPSFPEKEWNLMKEIFLQNLKINNEKTSYRASALIRKNIFGEDHPYGSSIEEPETAALSPSDFHDFFKTFFKTHSVYLIGNFDDSELASIRGGFESMPVAGAPTPRTGRLPDSPVIQHVEKEGSLQSSIRLGKRSLRKTDPDYFDVLIFNHLLGGFFGSRLMKNIREEKGLTYGIHSSLNTFRNDAVFIIGTDVNKSDLGLAVKEIKNELRKLRTLAVDIHELTLARNHFIGGLQTDMANLFSVTEKIKNIHLNQLPQDFYQQLCDRVDRVSPADILSTAGRYFDEETLFEVSVG